MAEQYGYFNGLAYDEDFPAQRIAALVPNGVYQNGSQVLADGSMKLQVTPGRAWINGYFYRSDEAVEVTEMCIRDRPLPSASTTSNIPAKSAAGSG